MTLYVKISHCICFHFFKAMVADILLSDIDQISSSEGC